MKTQQLEYNKRYIIRHKILNVWVFDNRYRDQNCNESVTVINCRAPHYIMLVKAPEADIVDVGWNKEIELQVFEILGVMRPDLEKFQIWEDELDLRQLSFRATYREDVSRLEIYIEEL